ncbi:cupin domain-containing protein [Sphingomonas arenae]|uniref:cupin domain-containing protein n=1 Tax=Sphingomonas arenae TaxID=2812555 RepID=UPI0019680713|nr:cupin domain-containing protein [Sphingomonas arenae]
MPKVDIETVEATNRTSYPSPYSDDVQGRLYQRIGAASGLTELGVSRVTLQPGAWSSQRHWHEGIDEFLVMIEGEAVLIENDGETMLRPGDCAAWPKDVPNAHHLVNRSDRPCTFIAVDNRRGEGDCHYPDIDLHYDAATGRMVNKSEL